MARMRSGYQKGDASRAIEDAQRLSDAGALKVYRRRDRQKMIQLESKPAASAGGLLTNRPPANRIGVDEDVCQPSAIDGGEDRFEISLRVRWRNWDSLGSKLAICKLHAKQTKESGDDETRNEIYLAGTEWAVSSSGFRTKGEKGPTYAFVLSRGGNQIGIANRDGPTGTFSNVRVILGSVPLMVEDSRNVWEKICREIDELGGEIEGDVPGRVDVCVDLADVGCEMLSKKYRADHFVCRATNDEEFLQSSVYRKHKKDTGFRIGAGIMLRVYDKLEETKNDDVKFQAVMQARWGGKLPEQATRVEFQIRREQLKTLGINTMKDWFEKRAEVVQYLCTKWIRFTKRAPDRKNGNQHKAKTAAIWEQVTEAFAKWAGRAKSEIKRIKTFRVDYQQLKSQMTGCALTLVAKAVGYSRDVGEVMAVVLDEVANTIKAIPHKTLFKKIAKKRSTFDSLYPTQYIEKADTRPTVTEWLASGFSEAVNVFNREFTDEFVEFARRSPEDRKFNGAFFKDQLPSLATG